MKLSTYVALLCGSLAVPQSGFAQEAESADVLRIVMAAFRTEGVSRLALRIRDDDPLAHRNLLKSLFDSTTVPTTSRKLPCAWPPESPPAGSGYDLDIRPLRMAADTVIVTVTSTCDMGPGESHRTFFIAEDFYLRKIGARWGVVKREVSGIG